MSDRIKISVEPDGTQWMVLVTLDLPDGGHFELIDPDYATEQMAAIAANVWVEAIAAPREEGKQ